MGFSITGYVLEPPRVGAANSPFTLTPANFESSPSAFSSHYSSAENVPRTDYLVLVMQDGKLPGAVFGWTKNEGFVVGEAEIDRFGYDGRHQQFRPLPGGPPLVVATFGPTLNSSPVSVPVQISDTTSPPTSAPFRLSLGPVSAPVITFTVRLVSTFGSPAAGHVELRTTDGQLNWNASDLTNPSYQGQTILFQQQAPFTTQQSDGKLGLIGNNSLLLTPIPGTGQYPLIRIGFGLYLTAIEVSSFSSNPAIGTVEWNTSTGLLKFNSTDITNSAGTSIYYDGVLIQANLSLPVQSLGTIKVASNTSPQGTVLSPIPALGGDLIFRVPGIVQFQQAVPTFAVDFDPVGKQGQVQYDPTTGQIQFSLADRTAYGGLPFDMVSGDLPIERGVSMRFFRCPVDLGGIDPAIKDVSAIYQVTNATLQSPIIQMPQVYLPSLPIVNPTYSPYTQYPLVVQVTQGTGSFISGNLPNQTTTPTAGIGYVINFDQGILQYAQRKNTQTELLLTPTATAVLPDQLVFGSNLSFAIETSPGSNVYTSFTESPPGSGVFVSITGLGGLFDTTAGQFSFTQVNQKLASGTEGSFSGTAFTDTGANFVSDNVQAGMYLAVTSGTPNTATPPNPPNGTAGIYTIGAVSTSTLTTDFPGSTAANLNYQVYSSKEVLADRFFAQVELVDPNTRIERIRSLGTITNSPRLSVLPSFVNVVRFRYGKGSSATFSTTVNVVPNDGAFTSPSSLPQGTVEVSAATGDLNFSQADVTAGGTVYVVRLLTQGTEYLINPALGNINFMTRFLAQEEGLITYTTQSAPTTVIVEPVTFLVRKELCQPHPTPTTTLNFNPLGRTVATTPTQRVWRGGRPQVIGTQCVVDPVQSTITFQSDSILTNALPHGSVINPNENVYVDYYVYEAIGGEKTVTVLQPPMNLAQVIINSDTNVTAPAVVPDNTYFTISGDYASSFPAGFLMRIAHDQVYLIGASSYDSSTGLTTVTLGGDEVFTDDYQNPNLYVASGPTPLTPTVFVPSYFQVELATYEPVSRGMNQITLAGNRTATYKTGTVLLFTTGPEQDFYQATGVTFDQTNNVTNITLSRNTVNQYDVETLSYSVRPLYESGSNVVSTTYVPVLTQPYLVFRRFSGGVGRILSSPIDYTIDNSGNVTLATPLRPNEEVSIFYTGYFTVQAGLHFQSSYTNVITPSVQNGVLNQSLLSSYYTFSPDSFYFRVESMTNFRGEYATELQQDATSSASTSGPMTSNTSSPQLFEQGRESLYFSEVHLANQDIIARSTLAYYNLIVNDLEAVLHSLDGRVVGDSDGLFKFDGVTGRVVGSPDLALNQIDDIVLVSPFPLPNGTSQSLYVAGPYSRFFKTRRNLFTTSPCQDASGPKDGDTIGKFTFGNISSLPSQVFRRAPRAQIQFNAPAGTTTFTVDNATGTNDELQRPAFPTSGSLSPMKVVVEDPTHNETLGNSYIPASSNVTVTATSAGPPQTITLSGGAGVTIPAGATITMSPTDANSSLSSGSFPGSGGYQMVYQFGKDVDCDTTTGELHYKGRHFPFDGTLPTAIVPSFLCVYPIQLDPTHGDILQADGVNLFATNVAPYRFPALDGKTLNDDGDQAVPFVGPTFDGEITSAGGGPLNSEQADITQLGTITSPTFVGSGTLSNANRTITLSAGNFPITPRQYDLVRILSGTNAGSTFRHVQTFTVNSVTVSVPEAFAADTNPFQFALVTTSLNLAHTGSGSVSGTTLTDGSATFTTDGTRVGYTVVIESGTNASFRRQIVGITDNHHLVLDSAFPHVDAGVDYRVDNTLDTYNGPTLAEILADVVLELAAVGTESTGFATFFNDAFTTLISSSSGNASGTTLTDSTVDFTEVTASDLVYVASGPNLGIYQVASTSPPHSLTTGQSFPSPGAVTYKIVSVFGISFTTLQNLIGVLAQNQTFVTSTLAWQTLLTTPVAVANDAGAYAISLNPSDTSGRLTVIANRLSYLSDPASGPIAQIENALTGTDLMYDARYTWIDARINQKSGLLVQEVLAVLTRIATQADILNQLLKILAVQAA